MKRRNLSPVGAVIILAALIGGSVASLSMANDITLASGVKQPLAASKASHDTKHVIFIDSPYNVGTDCQLETIRIFIDGEAQMHKVEICHDD
jgi:predicted metal-dependent phosphotriesterase family hydrolase